MAAVLVAIGAFSQWTFKLDTTFRTQITHRNVNSIAVQDDGIVLSGTIRFPGDMSDRLLTKVDLSGDQVVSFPFGYGGGKITEWNDRYYVSVGQGVQRVLTTGITDLAYIGMNDGPYFQSGSGGDYHVFEDGRVLITGNHHLSDSIRGFVGWYKLIWFSNEGYLDTTRIHRQANGPMWNFAALPDGKFLCSCSCTEYEGQLVGRVFRIHADGSLDTTFQTDVFTGNIFAYYPLEDGRTFIAGRFRRSAAPDDTLYIARLMPNGSMDPSFTPPNCSPGDLPNPASGAGISFIHPWLDGNLIISGRFRYINGEPRNSICMIDSTGNVLPPFHGQGVGTFQYAVNTYSSINHISEDDQGRLYIAGAYTGYNDGIINDTLQRFVSRLLVEEDTTVGISTAVRNTANFSLHPNPSSGHVHINFEQPTTNGVAQVWDALGSLVYVQHITATNSTLDLRALSDGLYFVSISAHDLHLPAQRLVLQR